MAYNQTTWGTDTNTNAPNGASLNTTNFQYKTIHGISNVDSSAGTDYFIGFYTPADTSNDPISPHNRILWATAGVLSKGYFVAEDYNPNDSSNIRDIKIFKLTPNAGADVGEKDNYTLLEKVAISNADLQAEGRGIIINFDETKCVFEAGDIMAIAYSDSSDVQDSANDDTNWTFVLREDWNNIIDGNI